MINNLKFLIFILPVFIVTGSITAQNKTIILSEKVGEEISAGERDKYNLFQGFENFKSAVYYLGEDGKFFVKIISQ